MTDYDPETLEWKRKAMEHEWPFAFRSHSLIDMASAIGTVKDGDFVPVKQIADQAWLKLKAINRSVRLQTVVMSESKFQSNRVKWLDSDVDENDKIKTEFKLRRTNPNDSYYYTKDWAYRIQLTATGHDCAITDSDRLDGPLESNFYCIPAPTSSTTNVDARSKVDVGIITIKEEEYLAVLSRLDNRRSVNKPRQIYEFATIPIKDDEQLTVAVARCLHQGNLEAQAVATHLINEMNPRWILLVGIAGGLPAFEFSLGDVIVASRLVDFSLSGVTEGGGWEQNVDGGPLNKDVEKLLKHLPADTPSLAAWSSDQSIRQAFPQFDPPGDVKDGKLYGPSKWRRKVIESLAHNFSEGARPPKFYIGPTASGNVLMKDTELASQWRNVARSIVDIEMELAGVYKACCATGSQIPKILAIRGISDVVGYNRGHDWLNYACNTAAAFAISMIQAGLLKNAEMSPD